MFDRRLAFVQQSSDRQTGDRQTIIDMKAAKRRWSRRTQAVRL